MEQSQFRLDFLQWRQVLFSSSRHESFIYHWYQVCSSTTMTSSTSEISSSRETNARIEKEGDMMAGHNIQKITRLINWKTFYFTLNTTQIHFVYVRMVNSKFCIFSYTKTPKLYRTDRFVRLTKIIKFIDWQKLLFQLLNWFNCNVCKYQ